MARVKLPFLSAEASIQHGLDRMREAAVFGLVLGTKPPRLLHYYQVKAGQENGLLLLQEILDVLIMEDVDSRPHVEIEVNRSFSLDRSDFSQRLQPAFLTVITVDERRAEMFRSLGPMHHCTGKITHYYPPHEQRSDGRCEVLPCDGIVV